MKFTITIEVPDGTQVSVQQGAAVPAEPFADELIPYPDIIPIPGDTPTAFRGASLAQAHSMCPVHLKPWRTVPAGVSKRTGKPYDAFLVCSVDGCDQRPAAA
jgi:hypothetical protein